MANYPHARVSESERAALTSAELRVWAPADIAAILKQSAAGWAREAYTSGGGTNLRFDAGNKILTREVTANVVLTTGVGFVVGTTLILEWTQDATGGRTLTLPSAPGEDWIVMHGTWDTTPEATNWVVCQCIDATEDAEQVAVWIYQRPQGSSAAKTVPGTVVEWGQAAVNWAKTLSGTVTFTETGGTGIAGTSRAERAFLFTNSGAVNEPTWPSGWAKMGSPTWDTSDGAKHLVLARRWTDSVTYFTWSSVP